MGHITLLLLLLVVVVVVVVAVVALVINIHLAPKSRMCGAIPLLAACTFMACVTTLNLLLLLLLLLLETLCDNNFFTEYWSGDQIKKNKLDGPCSTYGGGRG
jgi:hypothetical protein